MKTIRSSEFSKAMQEAKMQWSNPFPILKLLEVLGIIVEPDPTPLKAEFECYWTTTSEGFRRPTLPNSEEEKNPHDLLQPFAHRRVKTRVTVEEIL